MIKAVNLAVGSNEPAIIDKIIRIDDQANQYGV